MDETLDPILDRVVAQIGRTPWHPVAGPDDDGDRGTRYGGRPWMGFGYAWPSCVHCGVRLEFLVQVDLASLPAALEWPHRDGLVQAFVCTNPEDTHHPFADHVRWIPTAKASSEGLAPAHVVSTRDDPRWQPCVVCTWRQGAIELPSYDDPAWEEVLSEEEAEEMIYDLLDRAEVRGLEANGADKVGGWPRFVQDPSYPPCTVCQKPMAVLIQVTSNGLSGIQFGDLGKGHVYQCRTHPECVGFDWANN